jgi:Tol biopolymer transport system component
VLFQTIIPNLRTSTSTVDIFVCNLQTATARLVGLIASSFNFSLPDLPMALSADGRYVVFTSEPNAGLAGMPVNTYVCDLQTGTTTSVNVNPSASRGAVSAPAPGV